MYAFLIKHKLCFLSNITHFLLHLGLGRHAGMGVNYFHSDYFLRVRKGKIHIRTGKHYAMLFIYFRAALPPPGLRYRYLYFRGRRKNNKKKKKHFILFY